MSYIQDLGRISPFPTRAPVRLLARGRSLGAQRLPIRVTAPERRTVAVKYPAPTTGPIAPTSATATKAVDFFSRGIVPPHLTKPTGGGIVPPLDKPAAKPGQLTKPPRGGFVPQWAEATVQAEGPEKKVTSTAKPLIIGGIVVAVLGGLYFMRRKR